MYLMETFSPEVAIWIVLGLAVGLGIRIVAGILDKQRIEAEIVAKGGQIVSIRWTPFAKGWLGSKNERLYEVVWTDKAEVRHCATVKTAMLAGNYFADSVTTRRSSPDVVQSDTSLMTKNQQLQQEVDRLRRELEQLRRDRM